MFDLNLKKCENTPINIEGKGISGGEKRRLAFASEVLTDPMILFCDEPTSGLDSFMAYSVVDSMRSLAKQGKTIICTIHQPSSEIFEMFDKLSLLAEGKLAFIGTLNAAYEFFESQGFRVPYNYNPADFYIKNLAIIPADKENCIKRINGICEGFEKSRMKTNLINEIEEINNRYESKNCAPDEIINFREEIAYKSNFFTQMYWLLWRNLISLGRNPMAFRVQVVQSVFISALFGFIYFQLKFNQKGVQNMTGVLFLCLTNNSFGSMFIVVNTFPSEIPIFYREHQNRMYRVISYYLSRIFLDIPIYIIMPTIFMSICYWMANLNNELDRFFTCVLIVILVAQTSVSFGTFLSACAPSTNVAIAISGPVLVPLMIFSGFLLNSEDIPKYFIFLKYLSWFSYANENLIITQFHGVGEIGCDNPNDCPKIKTFETGDDVLNYFKANPDNFYYNIASLFLLIFGWRVMTFLVLLAKSRKR
jgi:ATP-binding cassette, subfamily G (WHITE), eye pigment precursor transporter